MMRRQQITVKVDLKKAWEISDKEDPQLEILGGRNNSIKRSVTFGNSGGGGGTYCREALIKDEGAT